MSGPQQPHGWGQQGDVNKANGASTTIQEEDAYGTNPQLTASVGKQAGVKYNRNIKDASKNLIGGSLQINTWIQVPCTPDTVAQAEQFCEDFVTEKTIKSRDRWIKEFSLENIFNT